MRDPHQFGVGDGRADVRRIPHRLHRQRPQKSDDHAGDAADDLPWPDLATPPRPQQSGRHQHQRIFPHHVENGRRDQAIEQSADHAAQRQQQIEFGQPIRRRPSRRQPLVTHQRGKEEGRQIDGEHQQPFACPERNQGGAGRCRRRLQTKADGWRNSRPGLESDDKRQQIERERYDPQKGRRSHIRRQMRRHPQHQTGRCGGQQNQHPLFPPGDRRAGLKRRGLRRSNLASSPDLNAQPHDHHHEQPIADAPAQTLIRQAGQRLDHDRIGQQGQETAQVRGGVKDIGVLAVCMSGPHTRIPSLKQRRSRRQHRERRADRHRQRRQQPHRGLGRIGIPQQAANLQWQEKRRHDQQAQVNPDLRPHRRQTLQQVRIAISSEQRGLEEHHRRVPHRRRSAQRRQQQLGRHRLNDEDQTGRCENGDGEQDRRDAIRCRGGGA